MANNKSIQILRGERSKIAGNTDSLLDGQLLYNKTDNYLTVGNGNNAKISDKPVACREVHGYFSDNSSISTNNLSAYNYEIKPGDGDNLLISSTGDITLSPGEGKTIKGKTPEEPTDNSVQLATTSWVRTATGDTALNAASATRLETPTKITTGLDVVSSDKKFDGSEDVTIPVSGVLGVGNGGTGTTTPASDLVCAGSHHIHSELATNAAGSIPILTSKSKIPNTDSGDPNQWKIRYRDDVKLSDNSLHVPGVIVPTTGSVQAGSFNATSDRRKKENIKEAYFDATDFVNHLRVVNFNYIDNKEKNIGLIAQEVDELDCGVALTATGSDGFEVLKETKLIYVLIKALQEANERIDELEKQIKKEG